MESEEIKNCPSLSQHEHRLPSRCQHDKCSGCVLQMENKTIYTEVGSECVTPPRPATLLSVTFCFPLPLHSQACQIVECDMLILPFLFIHYFNSFSVFSYVPTLVFSVPGVKV